MSSSPPAPPPEVAPAPAPSPAETVLAYAERIRNFQPPELAQEISGLGDPQDSPLRQMQLAIALGFARTPANFARAQSLLQRVLAQNQAQAQALHPLARMLLAQQAETRRLEDQLERQNQQTREAHRRIDQLNDRLEALRALERSLVIRPAATLSAPANGQRPAP
jgi:septal ring factor EnvC (AmiA/AmiB activator)